MEKPVEACTACPCLQAVPTVRRVVIAVSQGDGSAFSSLLLAAQHPLPLPNRHRTMGVEGRSLFYPAGEERKSP